MKRGHRNAHVVMWLVLTPVLAAIILLAWRLRPQTIETPLPDAAASVIGEAG